MNMGEQNTQEESFEQMDYSLEKGVNFFDTAEIYAVPPKEETQGSTEEIIGNWFTKRKNREKVVLATKIVGPGPSWIRNGGGNYNEKNISAAINGSLKRLKTDYIDLYQLHWPERRTNFFGRRDYEHSSDEDNWNSLEYVLENLKKFIDQGKIRYIGVSNETPWGFSKFLALSDKLNLPKIVSVQNPYNLLNRSYEVGLAEISIREKSGLLAYSPLAFGFLSGKYRNGKLPEKSRMKLFGDLFPRYKTPNGASAIEKYYEISKKNGLDFSQMSLKFCEIQPFVTSVIIGATTMEQLKTNIESVNLELSNEIIKEINEVQTKYPNPCP
jgi:aryl-alcohol dehydrogenase-like predicted oxidoreductase